MDPSESRPAPNYLRFFAIQLALTALEIGVAMVKGHPHRVTAALIALMLVNAAFVALNFMHLRWESRGLRLTVVVPLAMPVVYALALVSEGIWRSLK
jgi:caa(3)-type oxidase subunit IV